MSYARFLHICEEVGTETHSVHVLYLLPRKTVGPGEKNIVPRVPPFVLYQMTYKKRLEHRGWGIYGACGAAQYIIAPYGG